MSVEAESQSVASAGVSEERPTVDRAQIIGQRAQLLAAFDVAAEEYISRRIAVAEKGALVGAQGGAC